MLRDLAAAILGIVALEFAFAIPVEEEDEDLAWIDEKIRRAEEGPATSAAESPDMLAQRYEYLERLRRVRARMVEGEIA